MDLGLRGRYFLEILLGQLAKIAVLLCLDRGCGQTVVYDRDLSEQVAWTQQLFFLFLTLLGLFGVAHRRYGAREVRFFTHDNAALTF